jgi:ketosteroid isomerase-like protein
VDQSWVRQWIDDYADAWRRGDPDAVSALFTEGAVYRTSPFRPPTGGGAAIRDYWTRATSTQEDLALRFGEPVVQSNKVAVEWWATMRDDGREVTRPGCLLLDPKGVLVVVEAEHLCMAMRGVRKAGTSTITSAVRGLFRDNAATRFEAMRLIGGT